MRHIISVTSFRVLRAQLIERLNDGEILILTSRGKEVAIVMSLASAEPLRLVETETVDRDDFILNMKWHLSRLANRRLANRLDCIFVAFGQTAQTKFGSKCMVLVSPRFKRELELGTDGSAFQ